MIGNYGLGLMMQYGHIRIFSGMQPATADFAQAGTLLARVTQDGIAPVPGVEAGGLQFTMGYEPGEIMHDGDWVMTGIASGTPGWWRFVWNGEDDGGDSLFLPRIDGAVGESLRGAPSSVASGATYPVTMGLWMPAGVV